MGWKEPCSALDVWSEADACSSALLAQQQPASLTMWWSLPLCLCALGQVGLAVSAFDVTCETGLIIAPARGTVVRLRLRMCLPSAGAWHAVGVG